MTAIPVRGIPRYSWAEEALCASGQYDPDDWFMPYPAHDGRTAQAQAVAQQAIRVCQECPVRQECLQWAIRTKERWSIAGGLTPSQRTYLLRTAGQNTAHRPKAQQPAET